MKSIEVSLDAGKYHGKYHGKIISIDFDDSIFTAEVFTNPNNSTTRLYQVLTTGKKAFRRVVQDNIDTMTYFEDVPTLNALREKFMEMFGGK